MSPPRLLPLAALAIAIAAAACSTEAISADQVGEGDQSLVTTADAHWIYDGPLSRLSDTKVTVSLRGHTARVTGYLAEDVDLSAMPNARKSQEGDRLRLDLVYPIATGEKASYNSRPGTYRFQDVRPYRPDSYVKNEFGTNWVPWGGFPFLNYNSGVALHGPISSMDSKSNAAIDVFYLRRGRVSHGCNRMLGEHVTEVAHVLGTNMRRFYEPGKAYTPPAGAGVTILADFDTLDGKYVDVDYPTDTSDPGNIRPKTAHPNEAITMFGSWVASELPDGTDLPPDMKWEAGTKNDLYVFSEHARKNWVCSVPKKNLAAAARLAASLPGGELPRGFCAKRDCVLGALDAGRDAQSECNL